MKQRAMNDAFRLSTEQIEELAVEIREFLLKHDMWIDTCIYFNGKRFSQRNPENGNYYYNDREHLFVEEGIDPRDYFEYVNEDHILSMSFEGSVCHMIYYGTNPGVKRKFDKIFEKYGLLYEIGDHWNLTCYYIVE